VQIKGIGEFKKLSDYWILNQGLNLSSIRYRTQKKLSVGHLC